MTRPPCVRLYPAYPGNPRLRIEGESPQSGKDIRASLIRATGGAGSHTSRGHIPSRLTEYFGACQGCSERPEKSWDETPAERNIEYQGQGLYRRDLRASDPACTR